MSSFTPTLHFLQQQLHAARLANQQTRQRNAAGTPLHISGTGKRLTAAYEQLRNAAEYTEEHLLLQRAIRRFYNRTAFLPLQSTASRVGEELIAELTQAGYLTNDRFSSTTTAAINELVASYVELHHQLRGAHIGREKALTWILDILSVGTADLLSPHHNLSAFAYVAYNHYLQVLAPQAFIETEHEHSQYEMCLYIAVHQTLLKSDVANVRFALQAMYRQNVQHLSGFIEFNRMVDSLFTARLTERIGRTVSRYGAPLRILKALCESREDLPELLADQDSFMQAYQAQISKEYHAMRKRLNKGVIKSIIFLLITKAIIGVGIEVPYDLWVTGSIVVLPLTINLLFPPLYMAMLRLGLRVPTPRNTTALEQYMERMLYDPAAPQERLAAARQRYTPFTRIVLSLLFVLPLAVVGFVLKLLQFNIVQGVIFFVFLSTASFLGFRLSRMVRDMELVTKQSNSLVILRDFFYLPFISVGRWLSSKYAKINAVALVLDMVIELPLKTVLRLLRQWTHFLNEKHDELL